MWQMLYAFVALMTVSMLAHSQQQQIMLSEMQMMRTELAFVAEGTALARLDQVGGLAFADLDTTAGTAMKPVALGLGGGATTTFEVQTSVTCVQPDAAGAFQSASCASADFKEIVASVAGPVGMSSRAALAQPVVLSRIYSRDQSLAPLS